MSEQTIDVPVLRNDESTLEERLTENAYEKILPARYLERDENGNVIEEQEELFERVAKNIAVAEAVHTDEDFEWLPEGLTHEHFDEEDYGEYLNTDGLPLNEETARYFSYDGLVDYLGKESEAYQRMVEWKIQFQDMMEHLKLMPNTPCLINAGRELQMLSACFVLDIDDDMRDIHEVAADAAEVFQMGGGMGYPFSLIRPYGDTVGSTGGIASGPISFMNTLDQVCSTVAQAGVRRGAQMGVMDISHPDIPYFIHAKNTDVSLAQTLLLNDPDDPTHQSFGEALEEARELIDSNGAVPEHLRNAAEGHLSNFNISVGVSDEFMDCLENDEEFTLINPRTEEPHIATEETKELYGWFDLDEYVEIGEELSIPAQELWDRMINGAHSNGEPGVIYLDRVNEHNTFDLEEHPEHIINATNPCGEEPLEDGDACNLTHINLSTIVDEQRLNWMEYTAQQDKDNLYQYLEETVSDFLDQAIDWDEFDERIETGTRFLDNVVTMSDFPVDKIDTVVKEQRKTGLGIMGLAQLFIELGVEYGSEESQEITRQIMKHIHHNSKYISNELAQERGVFERWDESKWADPSKFPDFFEYHTDLKAKRYEDGFLQRNHETTTIAPTGTTSQIGNTSGGCEPIFSVCYFKNVTDDIQGDDMLVEFDNLFLKTLENNGIDVDNVKEEAVELMNNNEFDGPESIPSVPEDIGKLFVTTNDLSAKEHADIQCAAQEGVGSGISKTVNAPNDASLEDAKNAFEYIYENGGKSVTYYRDGSRTKQVQTTRKDNQEVEEESTEDDSETTPNVRERPKVISGETQRIETGYGNMYITLNEDENGDLFEVMATVGKSGGTMESFLEALARQVSLNLRAGVGIDEVIDQLQNIRSPNVGWDEGDSVQSIPDGLALALKRYKHKNDTMKIDHPTTKAEDPNSDEDTTDEPCPDCGSTETYMSEGCVTCQSCGWSRCGQFTDDVVILHLAAAK